MKEIKTNSKNINKSRSSSRFEKNTYNKNKKFVRKNFRTSDANESAVETEALVEDASEVFARTSAWNSISARKDTFDAIRNFRLARLNADDLKIYHTVNADEIEDTSNVIKSLAEKKLKLKFNIESSLRQERFLKRHIKRSITNTLLPFLTRRFHRLPKPKVFKNSSKGICYNQPKFTRYKNRIVRKTLLNNLYRARLRLQLNQSVESDGFVYDDNFQGLLDFFYKTDLFVLEGLKKSKILDPINVILEFKELARNAVFAVKGLNEMTVNSAAVSYGLKGDDGLKNISYFKTYKNFLNLRNVRLDNRSTQAFNMLTPETAEEFKVFSQYKKEISSFSRFALRGKKLRLKVRAYTLLRRMELALNTKDRFLKYQYRNFLRFQKNTLGRRIGFGKRGLKRLLKLKIKKSLRVKALLANYVDNGTFKDAPSFLKRRGKFKKYINRPKSLKKRIIHERRIKKLQSSIFDSIDSIEALNLDETINVINDSDENEVEAVEVVLTKNETANANLRLKVDSLFKVKFNAGHLWAAGSLEKKINDEAFEIFKYSKVSKRNAAKVDLSFLKSSTCSDFIGSEPASRYTSVAGRKLFATNLTKYSVKLSCSRRGKFIKIRNASLRRQGVFIQYKKRRKSRRALTPFSRKRLKLLSQTMKSGFNVSNSSVGKRRNIQQVVLPRKAVLFQKFLYRRLALEKLSENGLIDLLNSDDSNVVIEDFLKSDKLLQAISRSNLKFFFKRYARIFFYVTDPYLHQVISKIVDELPALSLCCAVVKNQKELLSYRQDSNLSNTRNMVFFFGKEPNKDVYRTNLRSKFYLMHLVNSYSKLTANGPDKIFTYRTTMDLATIGKITALFTLLDQVIVNEVFPFLDVISDEDEEFIFDSIEEEQAKEQAREQELLDLNSEDESLENDFDTEDESFSTESEDDINF